MSFTNDETEEWTVEELISQDDDEFAEAVTEDLLYTISRGSPFQDKLIVERTLDALLDRFEFVSETLRRKARDPLIAPENIESTQRFLYLLRHSINVTERRSLRLLPPRSREISAWKNVLNQVLDEIEGDEVLDRVLDEISLPFYSFQRTMTLREWLTIRRDKDPSRMPAHRLAPEAALPPATPDYRVVA